MIIKRGAVRTFVALSVLLTGILALSLASCSQAYDRDYGTPKPAQYEESRKMAEAPSTSAMAASPVADGQFSETSPSEPVAPRTSSSETNFPETPAPESATPALPDGSRKLIKTASLTVRVQDLAQAEKAVTEMVRGFSGYISSTDAGEDYLNMTIRVPQARYEQALGFLPPLGKVLSRNEESQDVTLQYFDLEGRLKTKRQLADTFRSYLKQTRSIKDIMAVETRLAELQDEIDVLGGKFSALANLVNFATIQLSLVPPPSETTAYEPGIGDKVSDVLRNFSGFVSSAIAFLVALVVFGVPSLLLLALLYWLLFGKIGLLISLWKLTARKRKTDDPGK